MVESRARLGVRARATIGAVLVVGLALALASVALVMLLDRSMTNNIRATTALQARTVADLFSSGAIEVPATASDDEFVQILEDSGRVIAATENVRGLPAIVEVSAGDAAEADVDFDDDPFMVAAAATQGGEHTVLVGRTLDQVVESIAATTGLLAAGVPLLLTVVGLVTWTLVGRALAPVERIRAEVDEISTTGLDRRVPEPASADEVGRLAKTMNRMLERLQSGQAAQRRFVSDASHELRSPVSSIRQHAELALAHPDSTSAADLAEIVLAENLRLQRLVDDLLLLTRMDEMPAARRAPVDLDDIVLAGAERLRNLGDVEIDASRVSGGRVVGDAKHLDRLVANLLDNAARHARTKVTVSLVSNGRRLDLVVEDDGPGIPEAERGRVFERFVRLDEARDRRSGGTGLGLAIVAEVASAHGGKAVVEGSPLGGARFRVSLPEMDGEVSGRFSPASGASGDHDLDAVDDAKGGI